MSIFATAQNPQMLPKELKTLEEAASDHYESTIIAWLTTSATSNDEQLNF